MNLADHLKVALLSNPLPWRYDEVSRNVLALDGAIVCHVGDEVYGDPAIGHWIVLMSLCHHDLVRAAEAAEAYLVDPPSVHKSNRDAAAEIIAEALLKARAWSCKHEHMVRTDDPQHAWKCVTCGYVYGTETP